MTVIETTGPVRAVSGAHAGGWAPACRLDHLIPGRGAAVLLPAYDVRVVDGFVSVADEPSTRDGDRDDRAGRT